MQYITPTTRTLSFRLGADEQEQVTCALFADRSYALVRFSRDESSESALLLWEHFEKFLSGWQARVREIQESDESWIHEARLLESQGVVPGGNRVPACYHGPLPFDVAAAINGGAPA